MGKIKGLSRFLPAVDVTPANTDARHTDFSHAAKGYRLPLIIQYMNPHVLNRFANRHNGIARWRSKNVMGNVIGGFGWPVGVDQRSPGTAQTTA